MTRARLPPHCLDVEEQLLGEVLWGRSPPDWFDPRWCLSPFNRFALVAAKAIPPFNPADDGPPIADVMEAMKLHGFHADALLLDDLVHACQRAAQWSVVDLAERIRALHRRRLALERAEVLVSILQTAAASDEEIVGAIEGVYTTLQGKRTLADVANDFVTRPTRTRLKRHTRKHKRTHWP